MADIKINCSKCGTENVVSEYAEVDSIECRLCGEKIAVEKKAQKRRVGIKKEVFLKEQGSIKEEQLAEESLNIDKGAPPIEDPRSSNSIFRQREEKKLRRHKFFVYAMWVLFIVLAGFGVYNRFYSFIIPNLTFEQFKEYGLISIGGLYLVCVAMAIKDNMFDGLLSLVVPFYCFYYLFDKSSSLFLRAVTGAFLITFGFDLALLIQGQMLIFFDKVSHWIATANE